MMNEFEAEQARLNLAKSVDKLPAVEGQRVHDHPKGWEPSFQWDGKDGDVIFCLDAEDDRKLDGVWEEIIGDWGLDPSVVSLVPGSINIRGWDANVSETIDGERVTYIRRMKYYKANLKLREDLVARADVDALIADIRKRKPLKAVTVKADGVYDLIVHLSDWQVGKGEGDGSAGTVNRILDSLDRLVLHVKDLKRSKRAPRHIYLVGMGDLVEQCMGHYAMQAYQTDLNRREQMKVVRYLILQYVDALLPLCERLIVTGVPGNHGENRNDDGKAFTEFTDNDDLAVFDGIAEVMASNPERYERASVMLPDGLSTTFRVCATDDDYGIIIGIAHGHGAGHGGKDPKTKIMNWWKGHAIGKGRVRDADILVTAHYHHFICDESVGRTWFQCPAQDPGSAWFEEQSGATSNTGMLVYSVSREYGERKWGDLQLI